MKLNNQTYNESTLNDRKRYDPYQSKIAYLLPDWLKSKNDFNEAKRLIDYIGTDMNKVKASNEDKKGFNDLNKLIIGINNNKLKKEDGVERLEKNMHSLKQLREN